MPRDPVSVLCGAGQKCVSAASSLLSFCRHISHSLASWVGCSGTTGMVVRSLQHISSSAGLYSSFNGVDLYAKRVRRGSSAFFRRALIVRTALSASPLLWGYLELLVVWTKSYDFENLEKSQEANCGPLSEMTSRAIPWRANMILS